MVEKPLPGYCFFLNNWKTGSGELFSLVDVYVVVFFAKKEVNSVSTIFGKLLWFQALQNVWYLCDKKICCMSFPVFSESLSQLAHPRGFTTVLADRMRLSYTLHYAKKKMVAPISRYRRRDWSVTTLLSQYLRSVYSRHVLFGKTCIEIIQDPT